MSSIGVQLEEAAQHADDAAIVSLATELLDYLDRMDIVYCAMEH
jgi:hypothetical protein